MTDRDANTKKPSSYGRYMCSVTRRSIANVFSEHKDIIHMVTRYELQHIREQDPCDIWRLKINKILEEMNFGENKWGRKIK